jgi:hypothetical protein
MTDEGQTAPRRAGVVFCGGCNPHIDRTAVADELPLDDPDVRPGTTVQVNGCPRACASGHRLTGGDGPETAAREGSGDEGTVIVVAGELVDGVPTPAASIAAAVTRKLKE